MAKINKKPPILLQRNRKISFKMNGSAAILPGTGGVRRQGETIDFGVKTATDFLLPVIDPVAGTFGQLHSALSPANIGCIS